MILWLQPVMLCWLLRECTCSVSLNVMWHVSSVLFWLLRDCLLCCSAFYANFPLVYCTCCEISVGRQHVKHVSVSNSWFRFFQRRSLIDFYAHWYASLITGWGFGRERSRRRRRGKASSHAAVRWTSRTEVRSLSLLCTQKRVRRNNMA